MRGDIDVMLCSGEDGDLVECDKCGIAVHEGMCGSRSYHSCTEACG